MYFECSKRFTNNEIFDEPFRKKSLKIGQVKEDSVFISYHRQSYFESAMEQWLSGKKTRVGATRFPVRVPP